MAVPEPVIPKLVSSSSLMKGMVGDNLLLKLISGDYVNFSLLKAKFKPNHEAYAGKMGGSYYYRAVLLYINGIGIDFDAKTGLAKINKSKIKKAMRSLKEEIVDGNDMIFPVVPKPTLEIINPNAKDFNSIVIAILPFDIPEWLK